MPDLFFSQLLSRCGQIDFKSCAMSFFTIDIDDSAVVFDDTICAGKAEARSAADCFGGKKGLENSFPGGFVHANSGV